MGPRTGTEGWAVFTVHERSLWGPRRRGVELDMPSRASWSEHGSTRVTLPCAGGAGTVHGSARRSSLRRNSKRGRTQRGMAWPVRMELCHP